MRLRRRRSTASSSLAIIIVVVVVVVVVMTALVVMKTRTLLEIVVVKTAPVVVTAILSIVAVVWRPRSGWHDGRRIALVGGWRVWAGPRMGGIWLRRVSSAHWSIGIPRRAVVKTHADRRPHGLRLLLIVVSTSTSSSAELMLVGRRVRGRRCTPRLRRTTWLLWGGVRLPVRLRWRLSSPVRRLLLLLRRRIRSWLLLLVDVLRIVGVIVVSRQSRLAGMMRLALVGPLLRVLRIAAWAWLRVLRGRILARVLRRVRLGLVWKWLLRIAVGGRRVVVGPATWLRIMTTSASPARMSATACSVLVLRVLGVARGRRRGRRSRGRRSVAVARHVWWLHASRFRLVGRHARLVSMACWK